MAHPLGAGVTTRGVTSSRRFTSAIGPSRIGLTSVPPFCALRWLVRRNAGHAVATLPDPLVAVGRPSIPPEQQLRALLLQMLYIDSESAAGGVSGQYQLLSLVRHAHCLRPGSAPRSGAPLHAHGVLPARVSTRKVRHVVETLCGETVSASLVSAASKRLDASLVGVGARAGSMARRCRTSSSMPTTNGSAGRDRCSRPPRSAWSAFGPTAPASTSATGSARARARRPGAACSRTSRRAACQACTTSSATNISGSRPRSSATVPRPSTSAARCTTSATPSRGSAPRASAATLPGTSRRVGGADA